MGSRLVVAYNESAELLLLVWIGSRESARADEVHNGEPSLMLLYAHNVISPSINFSVALLCMIISSRSFIFRISFE
jgi:hypothetical protein